MQSNMQKTSKNILLNKKDFSSVFHLPPFDIIGAKQFAAAFDAGMAEQSQEILQILAENATVINKPTFENTVLPWEKSGKLLERTANIFFNLDASNTNDEIQRIASEYAPKLAKHSLEINLNTKLFQRISLLVDEAEKDEKSFERDQLRLLKTLKENMVRAGVNLDEKGKTRMTEIGQRQAFLENQFAQNVLNDEKNWKLFLDDSRGDTIGLPSFLLDAMKNAEGKFVVTLGRSIIEPFLTFSSRRDLRKKVHEAFVTRGNHHVTQDTTTTTSTNENHEGTTNATIKNTEIIKELLALRAEEAHLLGCKSYSDFKLEKSMAKTPTEVHKLLEKIWEPAKGKVETERKMLEEEAKKDDIVKIEPYDWRYYAEKVRKAQFDLNEEELKPYFELENMTKALFYTVKRLFGVDFVEITNEFAYEEGKEGEEREVTAAKKTVKDIMYRDDVRVYKVIDTTKDGDGDKVIGIFLHDNFTHPNKKSGAWMSNYVNQEPGVIPIVVNNNNISKGEKVTLLSFDEVKTLFHEAGHGHHSLLSTTRYKSQSGTNVLSDFLEFPSQMLEHWMSEKEILRKFAIHYETLQPVPESLLNRLISARNFNKGFETVEYVGSVLLDLEYHSLPYSYFQSSAFKDSFNVLEMEKSIVEKIGMPHEVGLRHRSVHFQHLFACSSYASNYYVYIWAQILDADGFAAFEEAGDIFDQELAKKLKFVYSSGDSIHPLELFQHFRHRSPIVDPLLKKLGIL